MNQTISRRWIGVGALAVLFATRTNAQSTGSKYDFALKGLNWRAIGPAIMGGRIDDFAVVEKDPKIIYVATAAAGVLKTVNNGTTWSSIFDKQTTSSIGDVTVSQSDPNIVWVGSGEANNRQSSSWGDGVYKSTDAGETWTKMGLEETMHIGRILIHPTNPDIVYVAAQGRLWGPNKERGLFKTEDGGKSWKNVLYINEDTGVTDIVMDPANPDTVIAAAYQRRRTAASIVGSGPHSGLHRTTDGGKTWKKLSEGLPAGNTGRIGLDIYRENPKIVYALVENANGGTFRSEDGGETWKKMSTMHPRPMYFSQIRIDPTNDKKIWVLGVGQVVSEDGGRNWNQNLVQRVHADGHAMWINPTNSDHIMLGTDGGIQWTYDGGKTWDYYNNLPLAQFYEIAADMRKPYWVYGGLQDNGSWAAPSSTTDFRGPTNDEWIQLSGGDGFYAQVDPTDHNHLYVESQNGAVRRIYQATSESKSIRPNPRPGDGPYRFDWNTPFLISPHNPKKLLLGGNRLFVSYDRGDTWPTRSADLTTSPDRNKMTIMGQVPGATPLTAYEHTMSTFGHVVTLTESPVKQGVIYAGTDDGNLQVSVDDGKTYENVIANLPGLPKASYVSRVAASHHVAGRCYVSIDNHRSDDFRPYLYVTEDFGKTWTSIAANLPVGGTISVVREHHRNPNLLFVGTERGLWVSFDRGQQWVAFPAPLPTMPIDDLLIHPRENDLILATHAKGVYILDDITFLEQIAEAMGKTTPTLMRPRAVTQFRISNKKAVTGHKFYASTNAPTNAIFKYYLPTKPASGETVKISIFERDNKTLVAELRDVAPEVGINSIIWDMRKRLIVPQTASATENNNRTGRQGGGNRPGGGGGGQGGFGGGRGGFGPRVLPGTYMVHLSVGASDISYPLTVEGDPRLPLTPAQNRAIYETAWNVTKIQYMLTGYSRTLRALRTDIAAALAKSEADPAGKPIAARLSAAVKTADALLGRIQPVRPETPARPEGAAEQEAGPRPQGADQSETLLFRLQLVVNRHLGITEPLSAGAKGEIESFLADYRKLAREIESFGNSEVNSLNKSLAAANIPTIKLLEKLPEPR